MEALALKTVDELCPSHDERVELIGGEIVRRPMPRARHRRARSRVDRALGPFGGGAGPGGWLIFTEINVAFEAVELDLGPVLGLD